MLPVTMANLTKAVPETVALTYGGIGPCTRREKMGSGVSVLASLWGLLVTRHPPNQCMC
jgi:phosphomevalonate kinase